MGLDNSPKYPHPLGKAMAKKSYKGNKNTKMTTRRRKAPPPAEVTLKYTLPGDGSDIYIDLAKDLSQINRRLYHQGKCYQVSHVTVRQGDQSATTGLATTVKTLPYTWVAAQAYMKARLNWMQQQQRVRKESGQEAIKPAYEDFKIFMDAGHRSAGTVSQIDGAGNPVPSGEWDYSRLVYADQSVNPEVVREPYLHMVGNDVSNTDIGLINAYQESRATIDGDQPNVPATAADNIYALITSGQDEAMSEEIITNMINDNDSPPYEIFLYPGGAVSYPTNVDKCYLQTSGSNPVVHSQSFIAMCGLVRVYSQGKNLTDGSNVTKAGILQIHLTPGPSKGILSMNVGDLV